MLICSVENIKDVISSEAPVLALARKHGGEVEKSIKKDSVVN